MQNQSEILEAASLGLPSAIAALVLFRFVEDVFPDDDVALQIHRLSMPHVKQCCMGDNSLEHSSVRGSLCRSACGGSGKYDTKERPDDMPITGNIACFGRQKT